MDTWSGPPPRCVLVIGVVDARLDQLSVMIAALPDAACCSMVIAPCGDHAIDVDRLQQTSALPVRTVADGEPLASGHVHLLPHGIAMEMRAGRLWRAAPTSSTPIDHLLRSVAECCGPRAIGLLLTDGDNADHGASGLHAITGRGGLAAREALELPEAVRLRHHALTQLEAAGVSLQPTTELQHLRLERELFRIENALQRDVLQQARAVADATLARYRELHDCTSVGYLTLDADGRIVEANRTAARLLGVESAVLLGRPLTGFVEQLDRPAVNGLLRRLRATGADDGLECALHAADGVLRVVRVDACVGADLAGSRIALSDITEHRLSTAALRRSETRLRMACQRLAQAQEDERLRITEQLHDQIGRNLTALGLNLALLRDELPPAAAPEAAGRVQDSLGLLQEAVTQMRSLMSNLVPPMLGDFGLHAALRWWAGELGKRAGIVVNMLDGDSGLRLRPEVESALFRIAQEALDNAMRHVAPRKVELVLRAAGPALQLGIFDDGRGFDAATVLADDERTSWGITWMSERAQAIGATLRIESKPGRGTRVWVELAGGA